MKSFQRGSLLLTTTFAVVTASAFALTGCAAQTTDSRASDSRESATDDPDAHVVYSAWTKDGTLDSVEYTTFQVDAGAVSFIDRPKGQGWSASAPVRRDRKLTVTPQGAAIAYCVISNPEKGTVLTMAQGEAGEPVTCDASV